MKLPNHEKVIIPEIKIRGYILSTSHPYGRYKAEFFISFGFSATSWELMVSALRAHAARNEVIRVDENEFGNRYIIEGPLHSPDGRNPDVRVIWFIEKGEDRPRLVTVYPF